MVDYYCPHCGDPAYRGHRDYKCNTEECENYGNPVFTLKGKPLGNTPEADTEQERATA